MINNTTPTIAPTKPNTVVIWVPVLVEELRLDPAKAPTVGEVPLGVAVDPRSFEVIVNTAVESAVEFAISVKADPTLLPMLKRFIFWPPGQQLR